jgi:hypothetical protein
MAKVKLSVWLIKHHVMKMYGEVEIQLHTSLTSAWYGGAWGKWTRYQLDRRLGEPHSWSGCCKEEKYLLLLPGIKPIP